MQYLDKLPVSSSNQIFCEALDIPCGESGLFKTESCRDFIAGLL